MNINFQTNINYLDEWVYFLQDCANNNLYTKERLQEDYPQDVEKVSHFMANKFRLTEFMLSKFNPDDETYQRFFKPYRLTDQQTIALFELIFFKPPLQTKQQHTLQQLLSQEYESFEAMKQQLLMDTFLDEHGRNLVFLALNEADTLHQQLMSYLNQFLVYNKTLDRYIKDDIQSMTYFFKDQDFVEWMHQIIPDFEDGFKQLNVSFSGYLVNQVRLMTFKPEELMIIIGTQVNNLLAFRNRNIISSQKEFLDIAKILADETKFEILKFCLNTKRYGTEIANHLNVTGATISHHMNLLSNAKLVTITLHKNRVYYQTNPNALNQSIDFLTKVFNLSK